MVISKKSIGYWVFICGLLIWLAIYIFQQYSEKGLFRDDIVTKNIEGKVSSMTHIGKIDWFDKYQVEITLDDGGNYLLYSDEKPNINTGDVVRLSIPDDTQTSDEKMIPAIAYSVIKKAPQKIQF